MLKSPERPGKLVAKKPHMAFTVRPEGIFPGNSSNKDIAQPTP
jgi:hypothetical protein